MYKYLILFVLGTPLIGVWLVENGAFAMSVGVEGAPNGATAAFAVFASIVLLVAILSGYRYSTPCTDCEAASPIVQERENANREYMHFSIRLLILNVIFLLTMLFVFGGINVWLGTLEKGLFRTTLGPLGALPYLMTKFVVPALFTYSTLLLMKTDQRRCNKWMWRINMLAIIVVGSTWGFKTTGVFMLLPGLLIWNWKLPVHKLLMLAAAFLAFLVLFFFMFDAQLMEGVQVFEFLGTRLTVLQGDVSWYVWGLYSDGVDLPNYWPTLLAAMGDTLLGTFVSKTAFLEWMSFHYDWMLTFLAVDSADAIINGHSITGTPFAEGVIAGGVLGIALFGAVAGLIIGGIYRGLGSAIRTGRHTTAALLSTYFCFHVFAWLNGGGITQLFHISVLANLLIAYGLLKAMSLRRHHVAVPLPQPLLDLEY